MGEAYSLPHPSFNRSVKIECRDERLTSDAGVLLLREVAERLGITAWLQQHLHDPRDPARTQWPLIELVLTRLLMLAQGWRDQDDVERLHHDPVMRLATSTRRGDGPVRDGGLASQPTLSRASGILSPRAQRARLNEALTVLTGRLYGVVGLSDQPVDLDIDSLPLEVHGHQDGSAYNGHYGCRVFHPLLATIGENGDLVGAWLREGNVHTADGAEARILGVVARVQRDIGPVAMVRMDAGFPSEPLLAGLEASRVDYVARFRKNKAVDRLAAEAKLALLPPPTDAPRVRFKEIAYKARSWSRQRRIVHVHIQEPGELVGRDFYLVTSLTAEQMPAGELLARYRKRGCAEDAMGQWKGLIAPALSSANRAKATYRGEVPTERAAPVDSFAMNEVELLLGALAAGLVRAIERIQAAETGERRRLRTVRERVLKVGARVTLSGRYVVVAIAGSARAAWQTLWRRLERLRWAPEAGPSG